MTSEERHELRYQRRKAMRVKKRERLANYDNFEWIFSYEHLYASYKKSRQNVGWKASTQKYMTMAPLNVYRTQKELLDGRFKPGKFMEFDILERGKKRHIRSVMINERVVQRCICDYALVPMISRTFIYDNGASLERKGYHFSIRRLCQHLREHYRKHETDGYILLFDFSKFFDNVSHVLCRKILRKEFSDERILSLMDAFIGAFGDVGLGLGSQISQALALASGNKLDHYIKEQLRIKHYGRYMDDGYLLHESKEYLHECLSAIKRLCEELEIKLNVKKTQIVKLSHGFTWLKTKFFITESGKIVRKIVHRSVTRMRRKLKAMKPMVDSGKIALKDVYGGWQSWKAYASRFHAFKVIQDVESLYERLYGTT